MIYTLYFTILVIIALLYHALGLYKYERSMKVNCTTMQSVVIIYFPDVCKWLHSFPSFTYTGDQCIFVVCHFTYIQAIREREVYNIIIS
ncbi:hypothetical protein BD770DRAFT_387703 [Pilaira anomala]|nr:hypothetical protein BD770DRAFT_387703 [Pilaira anomala]